MLNHWEIIGRLVLAAILGGMVGLEREVHGRPAGIRTYLTLSLGSALFMVLSEFLMIKFQTHFPGITLSADPGRIAAQAVTGIGFLGAGVIIRYKDTVRGLTTAACVWVVCAIGLTIGAGFYLYGVVVACLTVLCLIVLKALENYLRKDWFQDMVVVSEDVAGQLVRIQEIVQKNSYEVINYGLRKDVEKAQMKFTLVLRVRTVHPERQVLQEVFDLPGVKSVDLR